MLKCLLLLFSVLSACQCALNPKRLGCGRMMGDYGQDDTIMERPMEIGDRFVVNGTVWPNAGVVRINLACVGGDIAIHMRADINTKNYLIWATFINGRWVPDGENSPMPYRPGQPYEVIMEFTGPNIQVYFNGALIYVWRLRITAYNNPIGTAQLYGTHTTNFIELICKNPPATTGRPRNTRRPGHGNGHGHGNGNGHGHGQGYGGGGKFGSSSSSES